MEKLEDRQAYTVKQRRENVKTGDVAHEYRVYSEILITGSITVSFYSNRLIVYSPLLKGA